MKERTYEDKKRISLRQVKTIISKTKSSDGIIVFGHKVNPSNILDKSMVSYMRVETLEELEKWLKRMGILQ